MIATAQLSRFLVEAADTLVSDFDLVDFLHTVTENVALVSGADAVGLMLADSHDQLQFMAASNRDGKLLELIQMGLQEGPCPDCYRSGDPVVNTDLEADGDRWPGFSARALAGGYRSVHAFPLRLRGDSVGAMSIFGDTTDPFAEDEVVAVQALADIATISILQDRAIARAEALTEQLQGALNSRIVIEQAKGAIALLAGVSVEEAFVLLRAHSRRHGLLLSEVARQTVTDPRSTASWWRP
ncbi:ANTAR domain-containing protein [Solicola sp. PLA-1-18]|uniref:ANTAR domain-containing protein n=1 Tax=Solicola sp. PLA-1-18 TaxID=3380532 RepID=UPI003B78F398